MTHEPDVTVILPVRNRASTIVRAAASVLAQRAVSVRLIVLDDASTDETVHLVSAMRDRRISVVSASTRAGAGATRNAGLDLVDTPFAAFIDSDDAWLPTKLSTQLDAIRTEPVPTLGCSGFMISHRGRMSPGGPLAAGGQRPRHLLGTTGGQFVTSGFVVNRAWLQSGLRFDASLAALEDQDLAASTLLSGGRVEARSAPLFVKYREAGPRESIATNLASGHLQLVLKHHGHSLWRRAYTVQHLAEFARLSHRVESTDTTLLSEVRARLADEDVLSGHLANFVVHSGRSTARALQLLSRLADPPAVRRMLQRRVSGGNLR